MTYTHKEDQALLKIRVAILTDWRDEEIRKGNFANADQIENLIDHFQSEIEFIDEHYGYSNVVDENLKAFRGME